MDNKEASVILAGAMVDRTCDPRQPVEILASMIERGHLPETLLGQTVSVEGVPTDMDSNKV